MIRILTLVAALALSGCAGSPAARGEPFPRIPPFPVPQGQQCTTYTVDGQPHTVCRS